MNQPAVTTGIKDSFDDRKGVRRQTTNETMSQKVCFEKEIIDDSVDGKRSKMADLIENPTDEELAGMSRSERKRHREKKRRSEVNKGFDELTKLLQEIDPTVLSNRKPSKLDADNVLNRVDLINVTVSILEKVHRENERNKRIIIDQGLGAPGSNASKSAGGGREQGDKKVGMIYFMDMHAQYRIFEPFSKSEP
jgi:hypothetical protein